MTVSVVLTVLNEGDGMGELLDALLAQSRAPDEIVVVDGGSRDHTLQMLHRYAERDARIKVHVEPGTNISRGRNLAVARAQGDILAVTDGGCRPDRDWLANLVAPLLADPGVCAVAGRFAADPRSRFEHYAGQLSTPDMTDESQRGLFYGRSSAFRRSAWQAVGGYPEWLYTGEDTLFAIAVGRHGCGRIVYAPQSLLLWRPRSTLRKLAKMFYLYGVGNGRIRNGDLRGCLYWLRYHGLLALSLLLSPLQPWLLLVSAAVAAQLWRSVAAPNLRLPVWAAEHAADRWFYVPLIAWTRNLATNWGFLRGWLDYRRSGVFKQRHEAYLGLAE